ncbi:hypothetical protein [uncultured Aquimarina sp.]|uniref:hypothetical protein n=1 Tax=uncultured Aquimarina sp. TaxID=575652 RepID=UPI00261ED627|nr:hypothetical protein [uncultured Aquimarina sp.]
MNVRLRVYIIFLLSFSVYGQQMSVLKGNDEVTGYYQVPQEKIFVHYNSSLLFTGEHLYYKLYCFNDEKNNVTKISKIAYVALVNEQGTSVFVHKIKLNKGIGQGDFFIPVSVPTGNYKVIGYTQWMLNVKHHFFQGDISILNPYQANQNKISPDKNNATAITVTPSKNENDSKINEGEKISIAFDQKTYKKRSLVSFKIEDLFLEEKSGTYSISVRKKDVFPKAVLSTAKSFISTYDKSKVERRKVSIGSSVFLPEMRGELIYGKIVSNDSSYPVFNRHIGLSVSENINGVNIVSTDNKGEFVFNLSERKSENNTLLIQVLEEYRDKFTIKVNDIPKITYPELDFYQFKISPDLEDAIIQRSVYNQIENNFYSVKPDSILTPAAKTPFYGKEILTYNLDDYTRFETIKETVVEVIDGMWTIKDKNGNEVFGIRGLYSDRLEDLGYLPLLLVDGIIEQDHSKMINSDAREIKSIGYIRDRYFLGSKVFEGIVVLETIDKDYANKLNSSDILSVNLSNLQGRKKYFRQKYGGAISYDRIPDYRNQLLWEPNLEMKNKKAIIDFYTSDIPGVYEISIEGFSDQGIPVSVKDSFIVE